MIKSDPRDTAFKANAFPCNPIPFINRMLEIIKTEEGTFMDNIHSPEFKANLHLLNSLVHGQLYTIDAMEQFSKLDKELE